MSNPMDEKLIEKTMKMRDLAERLLVLNDMYAEMDIPKQMRRDMAKSVRALIDSYQEMLGVTTDHFLLMADINDKIIDKVNETIDRGKKEN